MNIDRIDHVVMTVRDIDATCDFYARVLGMRVVTFAGGRKALAFGRAEDQPASRGPRIRAEGRAPDARLGRPLPDHDGPLDAVIAHLAACGVPIIEGPVAKTGATGPIRSVYFRDPDANLIEVSTYDDA